MVRQVLHTDQAQYYYSQYSQPGSPIAVGGAGGGAGAVGELDDGEEAEHLRGPARVGEGLKGKVDRQFY